MAASRCCSPVRPLAPPTLVVEGPRQRAARFAMVRGRSAYVPGAARGWLSLSLDDRSLSPEVKVKWAEKPTTDTDEAPRQLRASHADSFDGPLENKMSIFTTSENETSERAYPALRETASHSGRYGLNRACISPSQGRTSRRDPRPGLEPAPGRHPRPGHPRLQRGATHRAHRRATDRDHHRPAAAGPAGRRRQRQRGPDGLRRGCRRQADRGRPHRHQLRHPRQGCCSTGRGGPLDRRIHRLL